MAGRPIFKAVIRVRDTAVPVKLYSAVREERVGFRLLHKKDKEPLTQKMYCSKEHKPVARGERARGFEVAKGQYVMLDPEEIREIQPESGREIEVLHFVDGAGIDPRLYERPYYLGPDGEADRYALLARALGEANRVAICRWTMRRRHYLGVLRPMDGVLRLNTLRYAHEVIPAETLELKHPKVTRKDLDMAKGLIGEMSSDFDPTDYRNERQQRLMRFIEQKAKGEKPSLKAPRRRKPTTPGKLREALEKSLKRARAA